MTPLKTFSQIIGNLNKKPLSFWDEETQHNMVQGANSAVARLKSTLEAKELIDTQAYKVLQELEKDVVDNTIAEVQFIQHLNNLLAIYRLAPLEDEMAEFIDDLGKDTTEEQSKLLEYHIALENLNKKAKKLPVEEQIKADRETIKKVGIFYVLEYTLQVLYEFQKFNDEQKKELLEKGTKVSAGNLPAYLPLEDTFRQELCYKIFDEALRNKLLNAFYAFEEVLFTDNIQAVGPALQKFNLELLQAFKAKGLAIFKALVYAPFGNDLPIDELIKQVDNINFAN